MKNKESKTKNTPPLKSSELTDWNQTKTWLLLSMSTVVLTLIYYMVNSPRPYDDDNIGRYFMSQAAFVKPGYFLDIWGRPMAILLFSIPAQFGYWYVASGVALLTVMTCFFTYKAAQESGRPYAWMVVLFVFFQPLVLTTSFSLCAEPLAAFFVAIALYFYYRNKLWQAALLFSMVPLARSETVLILPLIAIPWLRERRWVPVLLLGTGLAVYQIAGMISTGDPLYLLTQSKAFGHGLYQNGPFEHYFQRFIFITGPVIFVFLLFQLASDIRLRKVSLLNISVVLMFAVHVYFYWKGNVASVGFLRHFVAVGPMIALLALDGFNRWIGFEDKQKTNSVVWDAFILAALSVLILAYYSFELVGQYFLSDKAEHLKFGTALVLFLLFILRAVLKLDGIFFKKTMITGTVILTVAYCFVKEKPLTFAPEHQTVKNCYDYYKENIRGKTPKVMIAHTWWFFFDNFNNYTKTMEEGGYESMRKEKLADLPVGSFVIWDSHYSHRLSSNVQLREDLAGDKNFQLKQQFLSSDQKFVIYIFEKVKQPS